MNTRATLVAVACALGTALSAATAAAGPVSHEFGPNLVANGGFETGDFTGWTTAVDPTFSGVDDVAAHSGAFGAYFGDFGTPGSIAQTLATTIGASYDIHLWVRSDGLTPNSLQVLWGGTSVYSATNLAESGYTEVVIDPRATSASTTLQLLARDDVGFLEVDDISVRAVPEPMTLALLGPALFGIVAVRRRKA